MVKTTTDRKNLDSCDLYKIVASFVILFIHTRPMGDSLFHLEHPLVRLCVPVFFMISAFLFFSSYDILPAENKKKALWKFIKRTLSLYLFWFILLLPFTYIYRDARHNGIIHMLGSSFPGSWFLEALPLAVLLNVALDRGIGRYIFPVFSLVCYFFCLGQFTYRPLADKLPFLANIYNNTEQQFPGIIFADSVLVALIWVWLGRMYVRYENRLNSAKMKNVILGFVISYILLAIEHVTLYRNGWFTMHNDVYLLLLPACVFLFIFVYKLNVHLKHAVLCRNLSTIIYCFHQSFIVFLTTYIIYPKYGAYELPISLFCTLLTIVVTLAVSAVILLLSRKYKIFRYAY